METGGGGDKTGGPLSVRFTPCSNQISFSSSPVPLLHACTVAIAKYHRRHCSPLRESESECLLLRLKSADAHQEDGQETREDPGQGSGGGQSEVQEGERTCVAGTEGGADESDCAATTWSDVAAFGDEGGGRASTSQCQASTAEGNTRVAPSFSKCVAI